ncbi:MAG: hypothetical protein Q8Q39_03650 [bacterium]|nr:hypothetical protein [bacterium]
MPTKWIIGIIILSTAGIIALAAWQQQKRLPELEARRPPPQESVPAGLLNRDKDGNAPANPLEFAKLFENLKPAKQECFRELFGEERLNEILKGETFIPSPDDNAIIGECLLAGATFVESGTSTPAEPTEE